MLADLVLVIHLAFVLFVVGGLALIWLGAALKWRWIRNRWFRLLHLAAIGYVALEALFGVMCPLTVWEDALRGVHEDKSFVARWIHEILFYDFPEWVFAITYCVFWLVVIATYWLVPPKKRER
jgi:uncharacterized protein DUF2784